ncbi:hypothetical protein GGR34_001545 [Microvirga flocculans]|uniref:Uncharacterized protein n=1 Tax=Microvirga flocculans TaxID=217168 RepID=A0A7W6N7A3_9HYPH|nr:hypothetical protein [Microvirga flocculans]MBB4039898.1 hypothetical protein [Microvirga flocculans]
MDRVTIDRQTTQDRSSPSIRLDGHQHGEPLEAERLSFQDPQEVVADPRLRASEKRAILAGWASDACAVENLPNWRKLPQSGALVLLDDILDALQALDESTLH